MMRVIIPFFAVMVLMAGCSGSTLNVSDVAQPDSVVQNGYSSADWDPLAPGIEAAPLDDALKAAAWTDLGDYRLTALGESNLPAEDIRRSLEIKHVGGELLIYSNRPLTDAALYLEYDPAVEHVVEAVVDRSDALGMSVVEPGRLALGIAAIGGAELDPTLPLARVRFAPGSETVTRKPAYISQVERSSVNDLTAIYEGEGNATLSWKERHNGDYNVDGSVTVSDLSPLGFYYDQLVVVGAANWAEIEVVDGNDDGKITVSDITMIGQNYNSQILGYNVYRMSINPGETPLPTDAGWVKLTNIAEPAGPSAPRDWNGIKVRVQYTMIDTPADSGNYAWYVAGAGPASPPPIEGPASNVATAEVGPPGVSLFLEIQTPHGELLNVNDEFYVGVRVANVEGLFSANVRFEYDSTLVEFMETVPFYTDIVSTDHLNFLTPPLFVGDDVGDVGDGYRQVGFNATERAGVDDPQTGEGLLGYVKFRAAAAGINESCFRFPQTTTYLYLWGATYGVAVGAPELGEAVLVNIAE